MDLSGILSISGKSGLFKIVSQSKGSVIVESLIDKKRFPAFTTNRVSSLEDISVFMNSGDMPLKEILKAIYEKENGEQSKEPKTDDKKLKKYFLDIFPDYDQERVYISDIRKIFGWYNLLNDLGMLKPDEKESEKIDEENTNEK